MDGQFWQKYDKKQGGFYLPCFIFQISVKLLINVK